MNQGESKCYKDIKVEKQEFLSANPELRLNPKLGGYCHTLAHVRQTASSMVPNFKIICVDTEEEEDIDR